MLKPGGRITTAVWNTAEKNYWINVLSETINKNLQLPVPPSGSPGIFRCSKNGLMRNIFNQAGFKNISESEVKSNLKCESADVYRQLIIEIAAPVVAALNKADNTMKAKIKREVYESINKTYRDGHLILDGSSLIIYGEK